MHESDAPDMQRMMLIDLDTQAGDSAVVLQLFMPAVERLATSR
jgi:hypothetical protein